MPWSPGQKVLDSRLKSEEARDIGPPPELSAANAARRAELLSDLPRLLRELFPSAFPGEWAPFHLELIAAAQSVIEGGGKQSVALMRGGGKTTILALLALVAVLTGRRRFVGVLAANHSGAERILKTIKKVLEHPGLVHELWPAETWGFAQLQGQSRRCGGQICQGERTEIEWARTHITFPYVPGSAASESVIYTGSMDGAIRGPNKTTRSGQVLRPDLILLDDPQTREVASNPVSVQNLWELVHGDVAGLSGPNTQLAMLCACTVIKRGDFSDRILSSPLWTSIRRKFLIQFPTNMKLWDTYFEVLAESLRTGKRFQLADDFYRQHQAELEEGAEVSWEYYRKERLTAIQNAMEMWNTSNDAFAAECQQEPLSEADLSSEQPKLAGIEFKVNQSPRGVCPPWATRVTIGVDVHKTLLYWVAVAVGEDFTAAIIDYGTYPKQGRSYFRMSDAPKPIDISKGEEAGVSTALADLLTGLVPHRWYRVGDDSAELQASRVLVDSGWRHQVVKEVCRGHQYSNVISPSKGLAGNIGRWDPARMKRGERAYQGAMVNSQNLVTIDVGEWKTILAARIATPIGATGALSIFGEKPEQHRLFGDHVESEIAYRDPRKPGNWLWKVENTNNDNHYLDALIYSLVAAHMEGCKLAEWGAVDQHSRRRKAAPLPKGEE